jgi:hypothetical protein
MSRFYAVLTQVSIGHGVLPMTIDDSVLATRRLANQKAVDAIYMSDQNADLMIHIESIPEDSDSSDPIFPSVPWTSAANASVETVPPIGQASSSQTQEWSG